MSRSDVCNTYNAVKKAELVKRRENESVLYFMRCNTHENSNHMLRKAFQHDSEALAYIAGTTNDILMRVFSSMLDKYRNGCSTGEQRSGLDNLLNPDLPALIIYGSVLIPISISQAETHGHVKTDGMCSISGPQYRYYSESSTAEHEHSELNVSRKHQHGCTFSNCPCKGSTHAQSPCSTGKVSWLNLGNI